MSQCVPSWHVEENPAATRRLSLRSPTNSAATDIPVLDYEVAELTWQNGQLALNGLGPPRAQAKPPVTSTPPSKYAWDKPRASGTLESIVNQATRLSKPTSEDDELVPSFDHRSAGLAMTMDALVPCSNVRANEQSNRVGDTGAGSCNVREEEALVADKRPRMAPGPEWRCRDQISVSGSVTLGRESQRVTLDSYDMELGVGFTSTSMGSPDNTNKTATFDDHDSVCHSRPQREAGDEEDKKKGAGRSSVSTKRSRTAAIHNQSERKRRDKINQRMKTLQKLVPNSSKTDKASMLDEVIEYLKQLQAQVNMMSRMNMPSMMLPMAMQQQLPMSMMASPMGMGMGIMDINAMNRATSMNPNMMLNPFMPPMAASWDGGLNDGRSQPTMMADPMTAFLACQSQPMTMDAYSRMAALYQQLLQLQQPASSSKN